MQERHTFRSAINQWLQALWVFWIDHSNQCRVDPSASFNTVKPTHNHFELHVIILILVLNLSYVRRNFNTFDALLDEGCGDFGLWLAYVRLAEQKLTVQVGDIDGICTKSDTTAKPSGQSIHTHVDDMNILEPRQGEVL